MKKHSKWKKVPRWVDWKIITARLTEQRRKKEFLARLKRGDRWNKTDDPGPH